MTSRANVGILLEPLLSAQTEGEFFIRVCSMLQHRDIKGFKCSTELQIGPDEGRPHFKFTYYMVIGHRHEGRLGYVRQPVWVFTLWADGTLTWDALHFEGGLDHDTFETFRTTHWVGLAEIKRALSQLNAWLPEQTVS